MKLSDVKWSTVLPPEGRLALAKMQNGQIHLITNQVDHYPAGSYPLPGPGTGSYPLPAGSYPLPGPGPGISGLFVFSTRQVIKPPPGTVYSVLGLAQDTQL